MIYEIMSIIPPKFSDSEIDGVVTSIEAMYTAAGAEIKKTTNLGKIKLAYPIDKVRYGTYILTYVEVDGEKVAKIDQDLRLSEDVLRHIIIVRPEGIPAVVFKMTSYQPPLNAEGRRAGERDESAPRTRTDRPADAAIVEKAKMSTAELNDKLDQILDSDILKNI